jgi:hypothetical protein
MSELRKYYDIEYSSQASVNGTQRVYLEEIEHDDFSIKAENDAEQYVIDNPEAEDDLSGDWIIDNYNTDIDETIEGDTGWTCCICEREFEDGYGNNPDPVKYNIAGNKINEKKLYVIALKKYVMTPDYGDHRCCDACNTNHVIPARLKELMP